MRKKNLPGVYSDEVVISSLYKQPRIDKNQFRKLTSN